MILNLYQISKSCSSDLPSGIPTLAFTRYDRILKADTKYILRKGRLQKASEQVYCCIGQVLNYGMTRVGVNTPIEKKPIGHLYS